ncbi:MAG: F510_1955 family glycosylhydrolase [Patescibacteria group bacterium]
METKNNVQVIGLLVAVLLVGSLFLFAFYGRQTKNSSENALTPIISFSHSHGIAVDISDPKKVYIATHEGLFLLSDDKDLFQIGKTRDDLMGFSTHSTEPNTFFSSGHSARGGNIGFQKTTDGGITWEKISDGLGGPVDLHAMTVSQANPNIVYGVYGDKLQRSSDGGHSWEYAKSAITPISLSSDPKNENTLYASTPDGVEISRDRGDSWQAVSTQLKGGGVTVFAVDPLSSYALAFSQNLGGMGKSTDGGVTWQRIQEIFGGEAVLYLAFSKTQAGVVYALTNKNSIYKSIDSGDRWMKVR